MQVDEIGAWTGGGRLDTCALTSAIVETLADLQVLSQNDTEIEVVDVSNNLVLHWGKLTLVALTIGRDERRTFVSRVEPCHFGDLTRGMWEWNPHTGRPQRRGEPIVFNPRIDGVIRPNRSLRSGLPDNACVFIDHESVRTAAALTVQNAPEPEYWTLAEAVHHLCWTLNADQRYIRNPTRDELEAVFDDQGDLVKHHELRNGMHLSLALDMLLESFGFTWRLELPSRGVRKIVCLRRGAATPGNHVTVDLQPAGQTLDLNQTNAEETELEFAIGNLANRITVLGGYKVFEGTFELVRPWPESLHEAEDSELANGSTDWETTPELARAHRDWVLDEAGDYVGLRPEITAPYDLSTLFGTPTVYRRRRFLPCVTLGADGAPIGDVSGITVEYSTDDGTEWIKVQRMRDDDQHEEFLSVHVLEQECGIRFEGNLPPGVLRFAEADQVRVRVTAAIVSDERLESTQGPGISSPLADTAAALVDAADRFQFRAIDSSSIYYTPVQIGALESSECDDTTAVQNMALDLLRAWDMADVGGRVVIEGLDRLHYQPGQVVTRIAGREISLNARLLSAHEPRYPQIVGVQWRPQDQKVVLTLATFRDPGA